jgi:ATP-binding cassette subfamily B protein
VAVWFKMRVLTQYREVRKINSKLTGQYNENITGVRVVKALVREERNLAEFGQESSELYRASFRAAWWSALFLPIVQVIGSVALGAIVWYGGGQAQVGNLTVGSIQAFLSYVTFMMWPIQDLARVYAEMQRSVASAERVFSLMDAEPEIVDRDGSVDPGTIRCEIAFENVGFYYEEDKDVLSRFNLRVRPGEHIALVGPTGGGKSTIVNLLCRFYEPTSGTIRIDGRDYRELTQGAIQSRIGMVLQTPHLFSGTIEDNIRYGRLDAGDEDVREAARVAHADEFIAALDKGYKEEVGEGGTLLSVGQKQLISLARAVLAQPDWFIMDEATSSVDTLTEARVQQGMEAVMAGRTSFVIAHRVQSVMNADLILVLDKGRIVQQGAHKEMVDQPGMYARIYDLQARIEQELEREVAHASRQEPV